jgi:hypothetical protein
MVGEHESDPTCAKRIDEHNDFASWMAIGPFDTVRAYLAGNRIGDSFVRSPCSHRSSWALLRVDHLPYTVDDP